MTNSVLELTSLTSKCNDIGNFVLMVYQSTHNMRIMSINSLQKVCFSQDVEIISECTKIKQFLS